MKSVRTADLLRPKHIDEIVGQTHLFGSRGVIRRMMASGRLTNMIFYGPPGTGKTTAAELLAREAGMVFHRLNATTASVSDVKEILAQTDSLFCTGGILLYIDEIQYFNRKQQQALLEYIEDGRVTLITSTTENPHFYIYNAIISRSSLFEFKPVSPEECAPALRRALAYLNQEEGTDKTVTDEVLHYIGQSTSGDVRHAIGVLENAFFVAESQITREVVDEFNVRIGNYDTDTHYDLLSCLQKSIRGSDPDATCFYLAKLLSLGELISVCRRLQVIASEDVGLAYPQAAASVRACCESAQE
ncbi:MAG: AAA family ATPase, partial [Clostridia bacterium]|nr:AAA family ATPase [Clostridia bacterium]